MKAPTMPCSAVSFADLAHRYANECRRRSWIVPGFKTLPSDAKHDRTIARLGTGGAVVSVKIYLREYQAVLEDMAAGVLAANREPVNPESVYRLSLSVLDSDPRPSLPADPAGTGDEEPF